MMTKNIHEIKTVCRLLPYAMQFRFMTIFAIAIAAFGIIFKIAAIETTVAYTMLSDWFLLLVPMYLVQMVQSAVALPGLVQSAGIKKAALTSVAALLYGLSSLISFTFIAVMNGISLRLHPEAAAMIRIGTLSSLAIMILFTFYNVLAYRYYLVSFVILLAFAIFFGMTSGFRIGATTEGYLGYYLIPFPSFFSTFPFGMYVLCGYLVTILCGILYYALAIAFYRKPLSERVFRSCLRKYES